MDEWKPLAVIGPACKGRFVRTRTVLAMRDNDAVINQPSAPRKVTLPKGAVGYCYAASGVLHVGFTTDFKAREMSSPTKYPFAVAFTPRDIPALEILQD